MSGEHSDEGADPSLLDVDLAPEAATKAKQRTRCLRLLCRVTLFVTLTAGAALYGIREYFGPGEEVPEDPVSQQVQMPGHADYFDTVKEDENLMGMEMTYLSPKGKETRAKFFKGRGGISIRINGEYNITSNDMIEAPEWITELFRVPSDPRQMIRGIYRKGDQVSLKLWMNNSFCDIPARTMTNLDEEIIKAPQGKSFRYSMPYELHGPIRRIPKVIPVGQQTMTFDVESLETEPERVGPIN